MIPVIDAMATVDAVLVWLENSATAAEAVKIGEALFRRLRRLTPQDAAVDVAVDAGEIEADIREDAKVGGGPKL